MGSSSIQVPAPVLFDLALPFGGLIYTVHAQCHAHTYRDIYRSSSSLWRSNTRAVEQALTLAPPPQGAGTWVQRSSGRPSAGSGRGMTGSPSPSQMNLEGRAELCVHYSTIRVCCCVYAMTAFSVKEQHNNRYSLYSMREK